MARKSLVLQCKISSGINYDIKTVVLIKMERHVFLKKTKLLTVILIFSFNQLVIAADIPVIVIAPSKKAQSASTVGSSVVIFDENKLDNSSDYFLGDILNFGATSLNGYQSGGYGQTSGIQLRGIPKRYSTVYIDGVKMSDPSTVSNDFYFDDVLKSSISRVEILKGNQSSLYGSGAMGGTINITTKKGKPGFQKSFSANSGSNKIYNVAGSISGADEKNDFYVGIERFETAGMSAMTDNDEQDNYRNGTIVTNYGHKISNSLQFRTNFRFVDTFLEYDGTDTSSCTACEDDNTEHSKESNGSLSLTYKPNNQFTNNFSYSNYYSSRAYDNYSKWGTGFQEDFYYGFRDTFSYTGSYNINLDNSVTFGYVNEYDELDWEKYNADQKNHANITSTYIDFQSRINNNLYATLGSTFDEHETAGNEDSHRVTLAYLFDNKLTKLKSSYGTSFRFPSLYELHQAWQEASVLNTAETGESWDVGIEKTFIDQGLKIDLNYFDTRYFDTMDAWKDGASDANQYYHNQDAIVKAQGIELMSKWKKNDFLNFDLNYTYTSSYDGADWDDQTKDGACSCGVAIDKAAVRVPRNVVGLTTDFRLPGYEKLNISLETKWSDTMRDYGNNNSAGSKADGVNWVDVILDDYLVNNLALDYDVYGYKAYFKLYNIFDEKYNTALDYSGMERSFNLGLKRSY